MNDPIKIIHKYKNNNNRIQYHIHIFLGDIVDDNCMRVLRKITDMDLYTALISLDERERNILEKNYGEFWYEKFFNSYHINNIIQNVLKNSSKMKELRTIYNTKWINDHLVAYQKRIETVTYNYEFMIREEKERKILKKYMQKQKQETEELVDYTTINKNMSLPSVNLLSRITPNNSTEENWCDDESEEDVDMDENMITNDPSDSDSNDEVVELDSEDENLQIGGQDNEADIEFDNDANPDLDFEVIEPDPQMAEFESEVENDVADIATLFSDIDEADKNIKRTTKEIKDVISQVAYDKLHKKIIDFDQTNDNTMFDANLKDIYHKSYITHQYIYKDDTIKTIHNKICCAFKNNNKFGENSYIIPSYQYLWSEYFYQDKIEKIMIGQKWIIKNDILKLDIEPNNNIGVYEDLRGNLKILRDNIRKQGKIKREDDYNNILLDYEGFFTYNELYMIDIYNELGLNYDANFEELKNLIDVYIRIYFPRIKSDDINNIINFLNKNTPDNKKTLERNKLKTIFDSIDSYLILENEIMHDIELVKKRNKDYTKIFQKNYVTQSLVIVYLMEKYKKLDLFRIYDNFILDSNYPFIQYKSIDGIPRYRWNEKYLLQNENKEIIMKWFENTPYGISFKVKISDKSDYKYMSINLNDNGKIDYKIQWKEEDMSTVDDIKHTYKYIQNLVEKINKENEKFHIKLNIPADNHFKFAFINTIQKFELPDDFSINHNDLSEFSVYFFPYVALVIEPRKRQSKLKQYEKIEKGKFGTYLRYKRVSKYENRTKIEHRIIFFMRNYEYDDQSLSNEISKEFNITEEQAFEEIKNVREKYPNLKKSRKNLKKLENIPKYKPPGIGVDIQGKSRNKYKMRIDGARDKEQLDRIITFMNVLIYLYIETYLYKRPDRQIMKDRLIKFTKIARRRNKVEEIVDYKSSVKTVKQMTSIDRKRLSYKAEEDQNQWTRNCQNSGDDKKRRPQQFLTIEELQKIGYVWVDTLDGIPFGHFERKVMVDSEGNTTSNKKKKPIILRALKLPLDDTGNNFIYYTCSPEENGKHMYVGFLNKSKNPYGEAMPCCFIKDHLYSKNKEKRNFFLKSIGILPENEPDVNKITGDQLYILQDSNKIQEGRFAFLPKYLDIFMNFMMGNDRVIKNHYLLSTPTGYYFKYGARQDEYKYLNALCTIFDSTVEEFKNKLIKVLENDKNLTIFTSLNNGDIRVQFNTIDQYITYIRNNEFLEYNLLNDLISLPGVIRKNGVNIIIFQKKIRIIRKQLEREKIKESYYIICQNSENVDDLKDPLRETAFIIKDSKNYYPIIMVTKENEQTKNVIITKTFQYTNEPKNIINHIFQYYKINCQSDYNLLIKGKMSGNYNAKETYKILQGIGRKETNPKLQVIDARFKCKFLITYGGYIIPTLPSGTIYNLNITGTIRNYIQDYATTFQYLIDVNNLTEQRLKLKPIGIFYTERKEKSYIVSSIMTENYDSVPIIEKLMTMDYIKNKKLIIQNKPNDEIIDKEISKGPQNVVIDNRVYNVSKNKYETELYQLFRYHLSYFLNNIPSGIKYKNRLENLINSKIPKREKKLEIKKLLYQMSSSDLAKTFIQLLKNKKLISSQKGGNDNVSNFNILSEANTPVYIKNEPEPTIQIYPQNFTTSDPRPRSNLRNLAETPDNKVSLLSNAVLPPRPGEFVKSDAPDIDNVHFPPDEKKWIHIWPETKHINYPDYVLKNTRELCYNNSNQLNCNTYTYCTWNKTKNMCVLGIKRDLLIDFINKVAEEFIQNELKAQEILRKDEYFVSDIVNYNIFTERPGEKIIMTSNTNLDKVLSEIFGKENIPRIGKRRNKLEALQNYDQLNLDNPLRNIHNWYIQNIIENNNTIFRAFANAYFWLVHPYNDPLIRNLGYYSSLQTNLANIYKSQVVDWLIAEKNSDNIKPLLPYIKNGKVDEFTIKLTMDVETLTNCFVELYVLSKLYETIIYINDENYNIIYVFHPYQGFIYDYRNEKEPFDTSQYHNYKKIINLRFQYLSKKVSPDKIEALYPKE